MAKTSSVVREDAELIVTQMGDELKQLSGTTMLVTGSGGFLLSYLLDVVAQFNDSGIGEPCRVVAVDNFISGVPERLEHLSNRSDMEFVVHDVTKPLKVNQRIDWVIHGASIASPTFYRAFPLETIAVNTDGTRHMLELARQGAGSMLYLSTSEIYGDPSVVPTPEEYFGNVSCTGPRACYDESKRLAETLCMTYYRLYGLPVKIVRPFNVYGPGQRLDDKRIMPDLMSAALDGEPLVLFSNGTATRSFCYVRDAIKAMLFVLLSSANGESFNVGNDQEEISIAELAERISKVAAPPRLPVKYLTSSDVHYLTDNPQRRCPELHKLKALAPWQPEVELDEGLARTLASYRELAAEAVVCK
ncbi:MAG: NAD-dependent epimerase/dehydratase family protein [Candidatus Melainabacteria bacterium]|nr:NAD-dependent epimerase/dehydratase family protein [Candidatus Melainabacteria bacterium]